MYLDLDIYTLPYLLIKFHQGIRVITITTITTTILIATHCNKGSGHYLCQEVLRYLGYSPDKRARTHSSST